MVRKPFHQTTSEIEQRQASLAPPDADDASDDGVRGFCPCHVGWEVFEAHVGEVLRALRDPSRVVRARALHVFYDAARMMSAEDLKYYVEVDEERIGEKRACHFRSMEERLEARKIRREERERSTKRRRVH